MMDNRRSHWAGRRPLLSTESAGPVDLRTQALQCGLGPVADGRERCGSQRRHAQERDRQRVTITGAAAAITRHTGKPV